MPLNKIGSLLAFSSVAEWHKQVARRATATANLYLQSLFTYWTNSIRILGRHMISIANNKRAYGLDDWFSRLRRGPNQYPSED